MASVWGIATSAEMSLPSTSDPLPLDSRASRNSLLADPYNPPGDMQSGQLGASASAIAPQATNKKRSRAKAMAPSYGQVGGESSSSLMMAGGGWMTPMAGGLPDSNVGGIMDMGQGDGQGLSHHPHMLQQSHPLPPGMSTVSVGNPWGHHYRAVNEHIRSPNNHGAMMNESGSVMHHSGGSMWHFPQPTLPPLGAYPPHNQFIGSNRMLQPEDMAARVVSGLGGHDGANGYAESYGIGSEVLPHKRRRGRPPKSQMALDVMGGDGSVAGLAIHGSGIQQGAGGSLSGGMTTSIGSVVGVSRSNPSSPAAAVAANGGSATEVNIYSMWKGPGRPPTALKKAIEQARQYGALAKSIDHPLVVASHSTLSPVTSAPQQHHQQSVSMPRGASSDGVHIKRGGMEEDDCLKEDDGAASNPDGQQLLWSVPEGQVGGDSLVHANMRAETTDGGDLMMGSGTLGPPCMEDWPHHQAVDQGLGFSRSGGEMSVEVGQDGGGGSSGDGGGTHSLGTYGTSGSLGWSGRGGGGGVIGGGKWTSGGRRQSSSEASVMERAVAIARAHGALRRDWALVAPPAYASMGEDKGDGGEDGCSPFAVGKEGTGGSRKRGRPLKQSDGVPVNGLVGSPPSFSSSILICDAAPSLS